MNPEVRCPFCNGILSEDWLKKAAASLMGKAKGPTKARANAREAALARWAKAKET
jgi:hypothetical protein